MSIWDNLDNKIYACGFLGLIVPDFILILAVVMFASGKIAVVKLVVLFLVLD